MSYIWDVAVGAPFWNGLSTTLMILLTAAIAWAGRRQAITADKQDETARNLLKLQETIEQQRNRISVFLQLRTVQEMGWSTVALEISNLSQTGIWLEHMTIHCQTKAVGRTVTLRKILPAFTTDPNNDIRIPITALVAVPPAGSGPAMMDVWAEVKSWANGEWRIEETTKYKVEGDTTAGGTVSLKVVGE